MLTNLSLHRGLDEAGCLTFAVFGNFSLLLLPFLIILNGREITESPNSYRSMAHRRLQNYLRTYRKRIGFSQGEVAFLLGCRSGAKVSHYERFERHPNLKAVLAYEIIFGTSAPELFAGVFEEVRQKVVARAATLARKLQSESPDEITVQKLEFLRVIITAEATITENP